MRTRSRYRTGPRPGGSMVWPRRYIRRMPVPDFTLPDQSGTDWSLSEHRDTAVLLLFLRGDW